MNQSLTSVLTFSHLFGIFFTHFSRLQCEYHRPLYCNQIKAWACLSMVVNPTTYIGHLCLSFCKLIIDFHRSSHTWIRLNQCYFCSYQAIWNFWCCSYQTIWNFWCWKPFFMCKRTDTKFPILKEKKYRYIHMYNRQLCFL